MKARTDVKEGEAGHSRSKEHKERAHKQLDSSSITPQAVDQLIENLERKSCWDDRTFEELSNDSDFQKTLDRICKRVIGGFKPITGYSWQDLSQDVLLNLRNWRPTIPGEKPSPWYLKAAARNRLIDVQRKSGERGCTFESLYELIDAEERSREIPCSHDDAAATYRRIRLQELMAKLEAKAERELLSRYLDSDKDMSDIALELGISRQAVSKRLKRIFRKLRPYV